MRLYYYKDPHGNFGDDLNEWLWERLLPGRLDPTSDTWLCAIGTLIGPAMPPAARRWIVFSSGAGYGPPPADFRGSRWRIACVRGPLTARVLGLEVGLVALGIKRRLAAVGRRERDLVASYLEHIIRRGQLFEPETGLAASVAELVMRCQNHYDFHDATLQ